MIFVPGPDRFVRQEVTIAANYLSLFLYTASSSHVYSLIKQHPATGVTAPHPPRLPTPTLMSKSPAKLVCPRQAICL